MALAIISVATGMGPSDPLHLKLLEVYISSFGRFTAASWRSVLWLVGWLAECISHHRPALSHGSVWAGRSVPCCLVFQLTIYLAA
jgi:hypothetical protein